MIPFAHETLTLLHKSGNGYARYTLENCSWRHLKYRRMNGKAVEYSEETVCRIPASQQKPAPGDLLIHGAMRIDAANEIELVRIMEQLRESGQAVFRVQRVKDNSTPGFPLPHYAATGE